MWSENKGVHGKDCSCDRDVCTDNSTPSICKAGCTTFQGLIDMWIFVLCPVENETTFHDLKCLKGECDNCGINMLLTCLTEQEKMNEKIMRWKCYEKFVHGKTRGLDNKVLRLQYKGTTTPLPHDYKMVWFYFGSGHGKGVHDGARVLLKQEIKKQQLTMDNERLWCVAYVVFFVNESRVSSMQLTCMFERIAFVTHIDVMLFLQNKNIHLNLGTYIVFLAHPHITKLWHKEAQQMCLLAL